MAKFNKQQMKDMNNNEPVSDKNFDQMIINKDFIMFNKSSMDSLDNDYNGDSIYGQYDESGAHFEKNVTEVKHAPILTKHGAQIVHEDIKRIYKNQERPYKENNMALDDKPYAELNDNVRREDASLNSDLRADLEDPKNIDQSVQYNDGASVDHPEMYQRGQSDGLDLENRGDLNAEEYSDGPAFDDGYPEDKKDMLKAIKSHPRSINYLVTNRTKPIMNNEQGLTNMQTGTPIIAGREETNDSIGIYVACANTASNRKRLNSILKKNAPKYQKLYQKNIEPYAQKMSLQSSSLVKTMHQKQMKQKMGHMMKRTWQNRTQKMSSTKPTVAVKNHHKQLTKQQKLAMKNKGIQRN